MITGLNLISMNYNPNFIFNELLDETWLIFNEFLDETLYRVDRVKETSQICLVFAHLYEDYIILYNSSQSKDLRNHFTAYI